VVAAQRERGTASIVLTGGGTGIGVLTALRAAPGDIDWRALDVYFGDERFVPAADPDRNELQARDALLDHVDLDPARVHPMTPSDGEFGDDPDAAAVAYANLLTGGTGSLSDVPEFDVHLLGMGPEGHMNSIFPHSDAVREESVAVVSVRECPKPPPTRVTLTLPAVRRSKRVWFVVSGANKAEAVAAAVRGVPAVEVPSAGAYGQDATCWFVDEAAASLLPDNK
ncbi:MAG: 6-phosphogluconolactonase, partial [Rhodococcus sp.]|nr:6-phosphogluconolactonase [Rhodococcus sp. (in: high G+C Gram-positive bacteria)]